MVSYFRREEHKLHVSDKKVLNKIYVSNRDEVSGQCRIWHSKELWDLHTQHSVVRIKSRWLWDQARNSDIGVNHIQNFNAEIWWKQGSSDWGVGRTPLKQVDETGTGLCLTAGFGITYTASLLYTIRGLVYISCNTNFLKHTGHCFKSYSFSGSVTLNTIYKHHAQ
jgi:hypothetical protein